ncbi:uncharacterized protein EV154DRAFT_533130 [Mucor mucedo]|uniref:uncharacterized protein n=1 Tax=Mucor mucedo TaxID=29922 RepID=UPI00221E5A46|nr:uncharacterized protein EV154DRAFT_533130 [Mucor mucedo]KAI7865455.1 hypothetical protein EV154DRAFT_533130 [Mucor mucedo]
MATITTTKHLTLNETILMSPSSTTQQKVAHRKKKAARACVHCQKAHLTCDDSRPCQRCIKRDLAGTCTDGARKKAKYLQDAEDNISCTSTDSRYNSQTNQIQQNNTLLNTQQNFLTGANLIDTSQLLGLDGNNYGFGSNSANLEYSILSNMLGSPQFLDSSSPTSSNTNIWSKSNNNDTLLTTQSTPTTSTSYTPTTTISNMGDPVLFSPTFQQQQQQDHQTLDSIPKIDQSPKSNIILTPPCTIKKQQHRHSSISIGYANASKPFSYADGYHYLINYVRQKMGRDELMRISKALALFRPSVLASMMNLTEDDLIFTEKCLQRTLLEYEKLITYSGTPTVVWRRTGEIALVGKEFSLLTQWSRDAILGKKTYIYELMSDPSAVEYWEKYALHAFDNTDSAVYSSCILMSPTKRVVPCTFCFTIKRDIFDLPSVIVGNFLPILS